MLTEWNVIVINFRKHKTVTSFGFQFFFSDCVGQKCLAAQYFVISQQKKKNKIYFPTSSRNTSVDSSSLTSALHKIYGETEQPTSTAARN